MDAWMVTGCNHNVSLFLSFVKMLQMLLLIIILMRILQAGLRGLPRLLFNE